MKKPLLVASALMSAFVVSTAAAQTAAHKRNAEILAQYRNNASVQSVKYAVDKVPEEMTVNQKKERFRALLLPPVKKVYEELNAKYLAVEKKIKTGDRVAIESLKASYKVKTDEELLAALKPHPVSIVLAQAAMESSWATSRFIREANNAFGIWSFDKDEPRIPASKKRGKKTVWLKKYDSLEESIRDSYALLARGSAYKEFRALRLKTDDPYKLVKKLDRYSEIGHQYGKHLTSIIKHNKFDSLDQG